MTVRRRRVPGSGKPWALIGRNYLRLIFRFADPLVPKDRRLVVFSQSKERYSDNSRALYEHLVAHAGDLKPVWLADTQEARRRIAATSGSGQVELKLSWRGFALALRARTYVLSHGAGDMAPYSRPSSRKIVLMLWHAVSYKRLAVLDGALSAAQLRVLARSDTIRRTAMIASSELDLLSKAASHGVNARRIAVTGLPRHDKLFDRQAALDRLPERMRDPALGNLILYCPTYRDDGAHARFFPFEDFDAAELNAALTELGATLLLRPHINDRAGLDRVDGWRAMGLKRIHLATTDIVRDMADLLPNIAAVVTDYSSVFIDALLLDIPCIFIPYDLDEYRGGRGLLFDFESVTPGPKVGSQKDLIRAISDAMNGAPSRREHRQILKRLFHAYDDGNSSARVTDLLRRLIASNRRAIDPLAALDRAASAPDARR